MFSFRKNVKSPAESDGQGNSTSSSVEDIRMHIKKDANSSPGNVLHHSFGDSSNEVPNSNSPYHGDFGDFKASYYDDGSSDFTTDSSSTGSNAPDVSFKKSDLDSVDHFSGDAYVADGNNGYSAPSSDNALDKNVEMSDEDEDEDYENVEMSDEDEDEDYENVEMSDEDEDEDYENVEMSDEDEDYENVEMSDDTPNPIHLSNSLPNSSGVTATLSNSNSLTPDLKEKMLDITLSILQKEVRGWVQSHLPDIIDRIAEKEVSRIVQDSINDED